MVMDTIISIVAQQFQMDEDEITEDTVLAEIGADDLAIADLVMAVEDAFEMDITIDEANALYTVGDLADLAEEALRQGE